MDRLDEMALLVAIADEGSLAAAARRLRRAPSAATRLLSRIETRLGLRLVERTTRRLALTESGRALARQAQDILARYEEAMSDAALDRLAPRGTVRVTAPLAFGRMHVAPLVARYLNACPAVDVELVLTNEIVDIIDAEMDVAVRIGALPDSGLAAKPLGHVRRIVVASPDYLSLKGKPRTPADIAHHFVIQQTSRQGLQEWRFNKPGQAARTVRPKARLLVNQAEAAISAALEGCGLVRPLSYQVADHLKARRLVRVLSEFEPAPLPVNLVFSGSRHLPLRTRMFVDMAASEMRKIPALRV